MQRYPMTPDGKRKLEERLKHLKSVDRPQNIASIEEARNHGDLSENAEYDAAKERQLHISNEIREVENKLALAHVIDPKQIKSDKVVFGATITLLTLESQDTVTYTIVGTDEADINKGKISIESPIARAMIGKQEGDEINVRTPKGLVQYELVTIEYV